MENKKIQTVNLLPEFLRSKKNTKFLASTIDQLIQKPELERLDGYIGSANTPTYNPADIYISEKSELRQNYQLNPALIFNGEDGVTDAIALDDLINELSINGIGVENFDRLFRSKFYSYNPHIDWDKFVNYQNYYWLETGPNLVTIVLDSSIDIEQDIIGQESFTFTYVSNLGTTVSVNLLNGMKVNFQGSTIPETYKNKEFFVEGVGTSIQLVDYDLLQPPSKLSSTYVEDFDAEPFDEYPFDGSTRLPRIPEYVTINRASEDLNPWSRYNRWVHEDVIKLSAEANNQQPSYPLENRAKRPIIEFVANLKLYNFGSRGISDVDFIDNRTTDAFSIVEGSFGYYVDGTLLEEGNTVIFSADEDLLVRSTIYKVSFVVIQGKRRLTLQPVTESIAESSILVNYGKTFSGTSWWFDGEKWNYSQQHTTLNQAPLFDLFDKDGISYSDRTYYLSNFAGNKIFGYDEGTGVVDPVLGFSVKNNVGIGSYQFKNYFTTGVIEITESNQTLTKISTGAAYCKIGEGYVNVWDQQEEYPIPLITNPISSKQYYDVPLGLTNNPLNGPIETFTLSEIEDHVNNGNRRFIINENPIAYAGVFIGKKEHNLLNALSKAADHYNQFKLAFLRKILELDIQDDPIRAVDQALTEINLEKSVSSPYYLSDMVPYGTDKDVRTWTVTDPRNLIYPITSDFSPRTLKDQLTGNPRAVLVYLNSSQLIYEQDYVFLENDSSIQLAIELTIGDVLTVVDYRNTVGSYVPQTPTKLGLYPKFVPSKFIDSTYINSVEVIQGHDGSIMVAYGDYRDDIVLELEKRIYNNIKVPYRPEILDINQVMPGAFRQNKFSLTEFNNIIRSEFVRWAGLYGVDYTANESFNQNNTYTWNYSYAYNNELEVSLMGSWRSIFKYLYDTDRPHTHPWEMLGFSEQPDWWQGTYGTAPYTSNNLSLWQDLEEGIIAAGERAGIDLTYKRPGLGAVIPVDSFGELIDPSELAQNVTEYNIRLPWAFGDMGAAETAWRRSSYWPFAIQRALALTNPSTYSSLMYDTSRLEKNLVGQWTFGNNNEFLKIKSIPIYGENGTLTTGYSVYVSELGRQRSTAYIQDLRTDIENLEFKLFYKVGGFINKNKLQIVVDSIDPTSTAPGALLPQEDYQVILNVSNPIKSTTISGIIIQKSNGKFSVKGYDLLNPYFNVYGIRRNSDTPRITVGGISEPYVIWSSSGSSGNNGLNSVDTTTARSAVSGTYYQRGQIVSYGGRFYRVQVNHRTDEVFNPAYYQILAELPVIGGATVQTAAGYENVVKQVPYGSEFTTLQEIYDLILGYGAWLQDQGFVFDEFNSDIGEVLDWNFSSKEFLYWSTQNWANGSVITISPFANSIKFRLPNSVVDNIFNGFYDYGLLQASGAPIKQSSINVTRVDGVCTIETTSDVEGIYFARLNSVQKEHAIIFNNNTIFNDTIYEVDTGYRQRRMKILGFRTADWDGDYFSPGFVYDSALISNWKAFTSYISGSLVRFNGSYYSAKENISASEKFDFTKWILLGKKPIADLLPNFDYKINQFEDFYSLDIDNFDIAQQQMAQHLIGYTPRVYLNNIFTNPISQYKFYQGFIKEKGTKNAIDKLAKASIPNLRGELTYNEEWAFRVGSYGSYQTFKEIEVPLIEGDLFENPQAIKFVETAPNNPGDLVHYKLSSDLTIKPIDYQTTETFAVSSTDELIQISPAGYVRLDDVTTTILNQSLLLSSNVTPSLHSGDTIWLGSKSNSDWDVLRYDLVPAKVVRLEITPFEPERIVFTTTGIHGLNSGDFISISEFDPAWDKVYQVVDVLSIDTFTVANNEIEVVVQSLEPDEPGLLFKFTSARSESFDRLPADNSLLELPEGAKIWIDADNSGKWAVYQKIDNYNEHRISGDRFFGNQRLGWSIGKAPGADLVVVGSPGASTVVDTGSVFVYREYPNNTQFLFNYSINDGETEYHRSDKETGFGSSVVYDKKEFKELGVSSNYGLLFAGAPLVGSVVSDIASGGLRYSTGTGIASTLVQEGLVKISSIDSRVLEEKTQLVLLSPNPSSYERFGHSISVISKSTGRLLLVGAPQSPTNGLGNVYSYWIADSDDGIQITYNNTVEPSTALKVGSLWGHSISSSESGNVIAISAPGYDANTGFVCIFSGTATTYVQTIESPFGKFSKFGDTVRVNKSGDYLLVTAPEARTQSQAYGKVAVYKKENLEFKLLQIIENPLKSTGLKFGQSVDVSFDGSEIVISSVGINYNIKDTFDRYSEQMDTYVNDPDSELTDAETTFDKKSTLFRDTVRYSGVAYVYNRKQQLFKLAHELLPTDSSAGTNFGFSVCMDENSLYIGAPAYKNTNSSNVLSSVYQFYKKDPAASSWNLLRYQDDLVDVNTIQKVTLLDTFEEKVLTYLDVVDPVKGKILGIANQELSYRSMIDPAIYSIGTDDTVNDPTINWKDSHVGKLWWDLSTAKYIWYEQGETEYRKNNWGKLFPGSSIDIYEWVESTILPSQWAAIAGTSEGALLGISGQPKNPDNSVLSVKQVYNELSDSFTNYYYFWVKNKQTVPNTKNRRISAFEVAQLILNPTLEGEKYLAILSRDSLSIANVGDLLIQDRISLNVSMDIINNQIPRHTEWLLLEEGSANSMPNTLLEKKLLDSLLGRDSLGNLVPDPDLPERSRYGISVRPRQGLFKDRRTALRNIVEFVNNVCIDQRITGHYSFANLNKQELIPDISSHEYDLIVEDNEGLLTVNVGQFVPAKLSCTVYNGRIQTVVVNDPGFGYTVSPTVVVNSDSGSGVILETEINETGSVISVKVVDSGKGYVTAPILTVRSYSVIVLADSTYNGKWTKFSFNTDSKSWIRERTQSYNTTLYWKYVDWKSSNYNQFKDYAYTVDEVSEIQALDLIDGDYVKVNNGGLGYYIVLEKTSTGQDATFDENFDIVYSENGTIQILDSIWDIANNNYNWNFNNTFDQTLFDQTPDLELQYILTALKNDIFVNDLKINWNLLFFNSVKYAMSEQKMLDWAFKTSFINVVNNAGELDQRPIYKMQDSSFYESYLDEVKPYHTKVRNFTTNYKQLEQSQTYITDFDFPAPVNIDTELAQTYPWKSWYDNYKLQVDKIFVENPGSGYTEPPSIQIVAQDGDTGAGATAKAFIRSGQLSNIQLLTAGQGYIKPPRVIISGGGPNVVTAATAYANITNSLVRSTTVGLKFDRITRAPEFSNTRVTDRFTCNGSTTVFVLSWFADDDRSKIVVKLNQEIILGSDYQVETYSQPYEPGYTKKYTRIVFTNFIPQQSSILEVEYDKNVQMLTAVDRIVNYYQPSVGMPGKELSQLMDGIEYPGVRVEGLRFDYSSEYDLYSGYDTTTWEDQVSYYTAATTLSVSEVDQFGYTYIPVNSVEGIAKGQMVNVISTLTQTFYTSPAYVEEVNTLTNVVKISEPAVNDIVAGSTVEFWNHNSHATVLDTVIQGGTWDRFDRVGAIGIDPAEIVIDGGSTNTSKVGSGFLNPNDGYAPEELVSGQAFDTLGINVYTRIPAGAPPIVSSYFEILEPGVVTTKRLSIVPPNISSILVNFNGTLLEYSTSTTLTSSQFTINWQSNEIVIPPQDVVGKVGYSIVGVGSKGTSNEVGLIDSSSITSASTNAQVRSLASLGTVKSAYVTVNGEAISKVTTSTDYGYILTYANESDQRAAVNVYNLPPGINTVNVWFFGTSQQMFNEIREERFQVTELTTQLILDRPPNYIKPEVANALVQFENESGIRLLIPPRIDYYSVTSLDNTTYLINSRTPGVTFTNDMVRAYVNGVQLRAGFDFSVVAGTSVYINPAVVKLGDAIAILNKPEGANRDYDYDIIDSTVYLYSQFSGEITAITYTDHDSMLMQTETFNGNPAGFYKISRPVLNENYIWVMINGVPIVNFEDFQVLPDKITIQISNKFAVFEDDDVTIITFGNKSLSSTVLGYRIFNDIFNRAHYKRLSKQNTTYLTRPLSFTDLEIHVANAGVLTPPLPEKNIPGVVLINGERIEFFKRDGNVLTQLRRSTLGTSPKFYSDTNTKVLDQSPDQTVPYNDEVLQQTYLTTTATSYVISTNNEVINYNTNTDNLLTFNNKGITLSTVSNAVDQISVFYGGRRLDKSGKFHQDINISYDSPVIKLAGSVGTVEDLPTTSVKNTAYIVTSTNQIWSYTASLESESYKGYVYKGLTYIPPEFTVNTSTQELVLNISEGIQPGIKLTIVKRQFSSSNVWNTVISPIKTKSLVDSDTIQAKFLQNRPAELPDSYYFGGEPALFDTSGFFITDSNNRPLEGF